MSCLRDCETATKDVEENFVDSGYAKQQVTNK